MLSVDLDLEPGSLDVIKRSVIHDAGFWHGLCQLLGIDAANQAFNHWKVQISGRLLIGEDCGLEYRLLEESIRTGTGSRGWLCSNVEYVCGDGT